MARTLPIAALLVAASAGHVAYPAYLAVAARGSDRPPPEPPGSWPPLSIVVPAYHEAGVIAAKLADLHANGYPGELEVLVVADSDEETAAVAEASGAAVLRAPERRGKAQGLNAGVAAARHELVVVTDANNRLEPGSLQALVRWFGDPAVAAVAGEKTEGDEGGEQLYWRFESWLKRREAALGGTIGLVGELAAVRASWWRPIPAGVGIDDLWVALDLAARGGVVAYEQRARAVDPPVDSLAAGWERRTRNVAGALNVFRRSPAPLGPAGGRVALQVWGHRLWRYTAGPLAHAALLAVAAREARRSRLARAVLGGHVAASLAVALQARGRSLPLPLRATGQVLYLQAVALGGLLRYARGERAVVWHTRRR